MRLPRYDELASVPQQLDVLLYSFDDPLFVVGPPGSGKTSLAMYRARALAADGRRVLVLTFNRPLRALCRAMGDPTLEIRTLHHHMKLDWQRRLEPGQHQSDDDTSMIGPRSLRNANPRRRDRGTTSSSTKAKICQQVFFVMPPTT